MEFEDLLARRRMVRNYRPDPIAREVLDRIVDRGLRGPSAGNTKGICFVLVTEAGTRRRIAELAGEEEYLARGFDPWISRAPAHIVVTTSPEAYRQRYREPDKLGPDREPEWPVPYWWVDAGAALMILLLAAVDEGLGAGFLGVHATPGLSELLAIPPGHLPLGVVTLGHPLPDRRSASLDRPTPPRESRVHWERWSG